jgi:hypothetical protein
LPERQSGQPSEQADRETTIFTMLAFLWPSTPPAAFTGYFAA